MLTTMMMHMQAMMVAMKMTMMMMMLLMIAINYCGDDGIDEGGAKSLFWQIFRRY